MDTSKKLAQKTKLHIMKTMHARTQRIDQNLLNIFILRKLFEFLNFLLGESL